MSLSESSPFSQKYLRIFKYSLLGVITLFTFFHGYLQAIYTKAENCTFSPTPVRGLLRYFEMVDLAVLGGIIGRLPKDDSTVLYLLHLTDDEYGTILVYTALVYNYYLTYTRYLVRWISNAHYTDALGSPRSDVPSYPTQHRAIHTVPVISTAYSYPITTVGLHIRQGHADLRVTKSGQVRCCMALH